MGSTETPVASGAARQPAGPRFQAVKLIGRGGMGFVQLAIDTHTGQQVAIKYIDRGFSNTMYKYTLREILHHQQLSLCQHPHIVAFQEIFLTPNYLAIVMEYVDGGSLQAYLEQHGGKLPEDIARFVFQQLIIAVDFIHRKGKVNRDIKLANVLVVESGKLPLVKLCDFGFSKDKFDDSAPQTQIGTALFAAPEIFLNVWGGAYDAEAVDMWSCGVVLFMLLFGGHPFLSPNDAHLSKGEQMSKLVENTVKGDLQLPAQAAGQPVGDLIRRMLVTDPERRFKMSQIQNARQSPEMIKHIVRLAGQAVGPDGRPTCSMPASSTTTTSSVAPDATRSESESGALSRGGDNGGALDPGAHAQQMQQQEQYRQYLDQTQQSGWPGGDAMGVSPGPLEGPAAGAFTSLLLNGAEERMVINESMGNAPGPVPAPALAPEGGFMPQQHPPQQQQEQYNFMQQQQQQYGLMQQQEPYPTFVPGRDDDPNISTILNQVGSEALDADLAALMQDSIGDSGKPISQGMLQKLNPDPEPPGQDTDLDGNSLFNSSFINMMQSD